MCLNFTFNFHFVLLCAEFHRQIQDGGIVGVYKEAEDVERPDAASVRNLRSLRHDQVSCFESKVKTRRPFCRRPTARFPTCLMGRVLSMVKGREALLEPSDGNMLS